MKEIELKLVKVKDREEGLYEINGKLEVRHSALLFYEGMEGAIKLTIDTSYKTEKDLEKMKKRKITLCFR